MRNRSPTLMLLMMLVVLSIGCGGGRPDVPEVVSVVVPDSNLGKLDSIEEDIFSSAYQGKLQVKVDEGSRSSVSAVLQEIIEEHSGVELHRTAQADEEQVDRQRVYLEWLSGKKLTDWNAFFTIKVRDPNEAVAVRRKLLELKEVKYVGPELLKVDMTPGGSPPPRTTMPLLSYQGYLDDRVGQTPSLNVRHAWQMQMGSSRVKGQGVEVVLYDSSLNFGHLDLNLVYGAPGVGGSVILDSLCSPCARSGSTAQCNWSNVATEAGCGLCFDIYDSNHPWSDQCYPSVAHGTGTAGIINGRADNMGVDGIAPEAKLYFLSHHGAGSGAFTQLSDGMNSEFSGTSNQVFGNFKDLEPGSIIIVEAGKRAPPSKDRYFADSTVRHVLPLETFDAYFRDIEYATAYGITVIAGAGNGEADLGNSCLYRQLRPGHENDLTCDETNSDPFVWGNVFRDLSQEDSGSILVGASQGPTDFRRLRGGNCGTPVDVFSWGHDVVTSGFPYPNSPLNWPDPPSQLNNSGNDYFVNNFNGTSAATALVGGVAVLIQSYAKMAMETSAGKTRFLMPNKIRDFLQASTVGQGMNNDCPIGVQPRTEQAMRTFDTFWTQVQNTYPDLRSNRELTEADFLQLRRSGVGLICITGDDAKSDPSCPESVMWPAGRKIAKTLDFDGDGKADLVAWERGQWRIDLSSRSANTNDSEGADGFGGSWDVILNYTDLPGRWVWPYAIDMNSDGRTDFVLYDKESAKWHITFTTRAMLQGSWNGWDRVVDYGNTPATGQPTPWRDTLEMDYRESKYSRPVPGDYNGDGWVDIAMAASDGYWRIDYSVANMDDDNDGVPDNVDNCHLSNADQADRNSNDIGDACEDAGVLNENRWRVFSWDDVAQWNATWDEEVQYLDADRLADAPGWAYLVAPLDYAVGDQSTDLAVKIPDGVPQEGRVIVYPDTDTTFDSFQSIPIETSANSSLFIFGGNDQILIPAYLEIPSRAKISLKSVDGMWKEGTTWYDAALNGINASLDVMQPLNAFGGNSCHPIAADFDGDNLDDRAVMCPDEWRIAYSNNSQLRIIPNLGYNITKFSLPGRSYSGGITYARTLELINLARQLNPNDPPPIPIDMVTSNICLYPELCE